MSEYQIEMRWTCGACKKENLGRHMVCQGCGDPKDEREEYVMPGDTSQAAEVRDEKLLGLALGGENWKCVYCGSDQRNLDGSCGRCGAGKKAPHPAGTRPRAVAAEAPRKSHSGALMVAGIAITAVLFLVGAGLVFRRSTPKKPTTAVVKEASWTRSLRVERRELVARTGFIDALPPDAIEVADAGVAVHHHDKVFDRYETETYTVTVPDGTRTETYSVQESCGQNCTTSARTCSKSCTPNKNGFATCKDVCTGGAQSCSTKYCSVQKTRQVPKTRQDSRTRQVERFRNEPRYAPQASYRAFAWVTVFDGKKEGRPDEPPVWPEPSVAPLADGGTAEKREQRAESMRVTLSDNFGSQLTYVPKDKVDFERLLPGRTFAVGHSPTGETTLTETAPVH